MICTVVAASCLGGSAAARALTWSDAPERPVIPMDQQAIDQAVDRAAKERQERRAAPARERRERSRTAYRDLGRDAALALATQKHAKLLRRPLGRQLQLAPGQRLVELLGPTSALVDLGDRNAVVASTIPLAVRDETGEWEQVDLDLVPSGSGFEVRRPLVDARVSDGAGERTTVGGGAAAVTPLVGAASTQPSLSDGRVFWADARTDTDVLAMPVPAGLEVAYMLRSPKAPEQLTLGLSLPDGAVAQRGLSPSAGVRIVRDGQTLGSISRPVAEDAAGHPVNVAFDVDDTKLVMRVDHRAADIEYPVAVDPAIELEQEWQGTHQSKVGWWNLNVCCDNSPWNFAAWDVGAGDGLNTSHDAGDYGIHSRGDWARTTPGNSYIDALNVRSIQWWLSKSCIFIGINRYAGGSYPWLATYEDCRPDFYTVNNGSFYGVGPMYPSQRVEDKNYVVLAHYLPAQYGSGQRGFHMTHWGNVELWYSDYTAPAVSGTGLGGWVDPNTTATGFTVSGTDAGVGVKKIEVNGDWASGVEWTNTHPCSGNFDNLCNTTRIDNGPDYKPSGHHSLGADLRAVPEGDWPVYGLSTDLVGRNSGWALMGRAKVDRSPPVITPSGTLHDRREDLLEPGTYSLSATATDGDIATAGARRSGVKRIDIIIDDYQVATTGDRSCTRAEGSCSVPLSYTFDTDHWVAGDHDVVIRATDQLGHTRDEAFTVYTDEPHNAFDLNGNDGDPTYESAAALGMMRDGDPADPITGLMLAEPLDGSRQATDASGSTRNTNVVWGISDQKATPFGDDRLGSLSLDSARLVAEFDVVHEALGNPPSGTTGGSYYDMDNTLPGAVTGSTPQQRKDDPDNQLRRVDRWMNKACPRVSGSRQCTIRPLVSFNPDRKVNSYDPNRSDPQRQIPAVADYERATTAFRQRYPFVTLYTGWNEANCCSGMERDPERAAQLFLNLRSRCGSGCVVGAGDFLDVDNLTDGTRAYRYPLVNERPKPTGGSCPAGSVDQSGFCFDETPTAPRRTYLRAFIDTLGGVRPAAWAVHAYFTGNRLRLDNMRAFVRQTQDDPAAPINSAGPNIWLTEQGGLYRLNNQNYEAAENPESTATGGTRATRAVRFLVGNPDTGNEGVVNKFPRITRFWLYNWRGGFDFDSGLTQRGQPSGSPRVTAARNEFWCYRLVTNPQSGDREKCTQ